MRRFVLLMLLAWLPLQASAMPWLAFKCDQHTSEGMHDAAAQQAGHVHHAAAGDQNAADDNDPDAVNAVHGCCHHFSGVAPTLPISSAAAIAVGVAPHLPTLPYDFIPELLKRPPLAHLV